MAWFCPRIGDGVMAVRDVVQAAAGVGGDNLYVEDVFSTYLYTGNGSTQTITNGIDLDGEGGLVWTKSRTSTSSHGLYDTVRGVLKEITSVATVAESTDNGVTAFSSTGYTVGNRHTTNTSGENYASWTFRKAPKFLDVVTWTGDGATSRDIPHSLNSVPGCIMVKRTSSVENWTVYHRRLNGGTTPYNWSLRLNSTNAQTENGDDRWVQSPTSTNFTIGNQSEVNTSGQTYVAYLFAHDAGGFGDDGEQNVISCGSYTGNGSTTGPEIDLGFEPQWFMVKRTTGGTADWLIYDNMRGAGSKNTVKLQPNTSNAEDTTGEPISFTATGFQPVQADSEINASGSTYIYIAIRRGPMKTPESGTEVFAIDTQTSTPPNYTSDFVTDMVLLRGNVSGGGDNEILSRLTGTNRLRTNSTVAQLAYGSSYAWDLMDGFGRSIGGTSSTAYSWMFRRAPSFFDVVAYTGTGANKTEAHNLTVAPELWIVKGRSGATAWRVGCTALANTEALVLNTTEAKVTDATSWNSTFPSSTVLSLGTQANVNTNTATYIAYLFATVAGVSKVGSYTGTGTTLAIDCGFSAGARFVLIRRTDSTGDWYVWDTVRGIVSGNDPYLLLNSAAAEVTGTDYIDPSSAGFEISSTAPVAINASGGSYIFLAIA